MILCRNPAVLAGYRMCAVSVTITETDVPREIREGISHANGWDQEWDGLITSDLGLEALF